jgi:ectoine hydroxylase-related dioxygenase (phytanoyl-CoA dioxygenase family)
VRALAEAILGPGAFPVKGTLFDKTPGANWKVPWHQDLTIEVEARPADPPPGFGPWSRKDGADCVQPPFEVLARMLAVRVHLDDCGEDNAPLRVVPGSHAAGRRLEGDEILALVERGPEAVCAVARGGVVLMRPALLHASSPSKSPGARRVVHLEFASDPLPAPLAWLAS